MWCYFSVFGVKVNPVSDQGNGIKNLKAKMWFSDSSWLKTKMQFVCKWSVTKQKNIFCYAQPNLMEGWCVYLLMYDEISLQFEC